MAQLWKVRLPNGNIMTPGDWTSSWPLWSTVEVAAGPFPLLTFFSYGFGGEVPGSPGPRNANERDTDMEGPGGQLPENEELICFNLGMELYKIGPAFDTDAFPDCDEPDVPLPDMLRCQRDLLVEFRIAEVKDYTRAPLSYWPAGIGVQFVQAGGRSKVSGAAATGQMAGFNGSPQAYDQRSFASPLYVAGGETMTVNMRPARGEVMNLNLDPDGDSRIRVICYLDGYRRLPVA